MKRRHFIANSTFLILSTIHFSCSVGLEEGQKQTIRRGSEGRSAGRRSSRRQSGPSDIKSLSEILQRAGYPLTEHQINYLLTLNPGPEFSQKMIEVLDDKQIQAVKSASGGRGRRRR